MNIEKKYIRRLLKKSLKSDFEKILAEAKMSDVTIDYGSSSIYSKEETAGHHQGQ